LLEHLRNWGIKWPLSVKLLTIRGAKRIQGGISVKVEEEIHHYCFCDLMHS